ncbi:MAG: Com family DNA-binding transcriptional regulator [Desulfovibrio sp.]|jgi:phage FluMu protein Com|nr:Com family DNA-binding transcriptional regulator [Desulfovibrio sp.]
MKAEPVITSAIRCGTCNKLLAKGHMDAGEIELLCPRCKTRHLLRASCPNPAPRDGLYGDRHAHEVPSSRR